LAILIVKVTEIAFLTSFALLKIRVR